MRALFDSPAALILILLVIVLFGAKRLPDSARSVGRSIRIFKAEIDGDGKSAGKSDKAEADQDKASEA